MRRCNTMDKVHVDFFISWISNSEIKKLWKSDMGTPPGRVSCVASVSTWGFQNFSLFDPIPLIPLDSTFPTSKPYKQKHSLLIQTKRILFHSNAQFRKQVWTILKMKHTINHCNQSGLPFQMDSTLKLYWIYST